LAEAGLRNYEARRHHRANFVIRQSPRIGTMAQLTSPVGVWLREVFGSASWAQKQTERLFERMLRVDLPGACQVIPATPIASLSSG
jgi:hypothetical protein